MSGTISSPLVPQGTLNRLRGNIQVVSFPVLNISASYLGEGGFEFTRTGPATTMLPTMTGRVVSPEPYQSVDLAVHLVRAQSLAGQWEAQLMSLSAIGNITVYTDSMVLPVYNFQNCAIMNVGPLGATGKSTDYLLTLTGTLVINNQLWALTV